MKSLNTIIFIFVISVTSVFAQNTGISKYNKLNIPIIGYAVHNGQIFLAAENGFIPVEENKAINKIWQDYYREIYGDSTLINPNTIIGERNSQIPVQFFIPVDIEKWINHGYSFTKQFHLFDFMRMDSAGNYIYKPGILGIIGSLKKKNGLNFPKVK